MLRHYSHIRMKAKREALERVAQKHPLPSCVTNHVTNALLTDGKPESEHAEVAESTDVSLVELVGIEPTTSSLRTMRSPS
jgi:hypothetical protein